MGCLVGVALHQVAITPRGIGLGGFGEVYFAVTDSGKEGALKLLQRNEQIELRGVRACLNLKHPNLVPIYDIRVDADEATYPCHVILRYEIERQLVEGTLRVTDIPEAWDVSMRALLGLSTAGNFKDGCMQDVHWPAGLVGYFPTYTLGALTAAQLFAAARRALPALSDQIAAGDFKPLDAWLREHVWSQASLRTTPELITEATGAPLGTESFKRHLRARYLGE